MHVSLSGLATSLIVCSLPAWATTITVDASFPAYETYSYAAITPAPIGFDAFSDYSSDPNADTAYFSYTLPPSSSTSVPGATASITGGSYITSATTTLGSNHAYAQGGSFVSTELGASSISGWYDQVTINGGSGTGVAHFTVQLNGSVDVGSVKGELNYFLRSSSEHPSLIGNQNLVFNTLGPAQPIWTTSWGYEGSSITNYSLGASPYNDTSVLFPTEPLQPVFPTVPGLPALEDPATQLGADGGMGLFGFYVSDLILTPGAEQSISVLLHGSLEFTYDVPFYLISGLSSDLLDCIALQEYRDLFAESICGAGPTDGTGATILDFSNSANLINIALPQGATASFASGNGYNVTTVPEPSSITLAGLGLVGMGVIGWRARRRS